MVTIIQKMDQRKRKQCKLEKLTAGIVAQVGRGSVLTLWCPFLWRTVNKWQILTKFQSDFAVFRMWIVPLTKVNQTDTGGEKGTNFAISQDF